MKKTILSKAASAAIAGTMALGAFLPAGAAFAQTIVPSSNNYYVLGGYDGGFGGSNWGGYGNGNLSHLFVLGRLFGGPYGNGVIGSGTSLGDLLILNQIFNRGWNY